MRDIRFRAWDKKGRFDMADVSVVDTTEKYIVVADGFQWDIDKETQESECVAKFDEIELMQYTGLKDKNGKEIYEGDIIRQEDIGNWDKDGNEQFEIIEVKFYPISGYKIWPHDVEVIGNIYEHPELLTAEEVK